VLEIELIVPDRNVVRRRLDWGSYSIGRALGADVRLKHESVAKQHARLTVTADQLSLSELDAQHGILKDGKRVDIYGPLRVGDEFVLGACRLKVVSSLFDTPPARSVPAPSVAAVAAPTARSEIASAVPEHDRRDAATDTALYGDEIKPLQEKVHALVLQELDLFRRTALGTMASATLRAEARKAIERIIATGAVQLPPALDRASFVQELTAEIIGYGPLEPFLADESVSEIMVNGPDRIYIERRGRLALAPERFISSDSLLRVIERIVSPLGRRLDEGSPMVDARLPDGSRVNAIIPPLSLVGPVLTIRKFSKQRFTMERLVEFGSLTPAMAEFLRICVRNRRNILVSGGTGSGKTTFLNALSASIPTSERIVTIEDAAELQLAQPHVVALEARPKNVEGRGEVAIRDLVRNSLRMRPDRIIIGECRGGEALDMLQAMNTGHDGSLTTGHANSPRDLLARLEVMVLMAGMDLPVRAIREQIASAINIVVQQTRFSDGRRRVTSIVEIDGMEGDVILTQPLFAFKQHGVSQTGDVLGEHVAFGRAPAFYDELDEAGVKLDRTIFGARTELRAHKT
jgi:pilus assembly protein CpaF